MSHVEPTRHGGQLSVADVGAVVTRAQHLVDARPRDGYPLAWCIEAAYVGDLTALAMVAGQATRPATPEGRMGT
jgi:hypothetical protein